MKRLLLILFSVIIASIAMCSCSAHKVSGDEIASDASSITESRTESGNVSSEDRNGTGLALKMLDAVRKAYGDDYLPNTDISPDRLADDFGISSQYIKEFAAQTADMDVNADTIIIIEAQDGHVEDLLAELGDYRDMLIKDTEGYSLNKFKIRASQISSIGNYAVFVMLGNVQENLMDDDLAQLEHATKRNLIALDEIRNVYYSH